jgi:hypothetical protein
MNREQTANHPERQQHLRAAGLFLAGSVPKRKCGESEKSKVSDAMNGRKRLILQSNKQAKL